MKSTVKDVLQCLQEVAPFEFQEKYDNAGLLIGDPNQVVTGVVTCLDSTEEVIDEAIASGANLVVAHHPIVFGGLKRFTGSNYIQKTVIKAIKNDIAIIAIHTNLDNVLSSGVNEKIAHKIGLQNIEILAPKPEMEYQGQKIGAGVLGTLNTPMSSIDFLMHLKQSMELDVIKHTNVCKDKIEKVAVCGGSGGFLLSDAIRSGADIFITSDYKYHEFFDANDQIIIVDIGHYESEKFTVDILYDIINKNFSTFAPQRTKIITNPIKYL